MANSTRTKWMAQCVSDIFNINEYESLVSTVAQSFSWTVRVCRRFFGISRRGYFIEALKV